MAAITGYELRARGKIDVYFDDDTIETWNASELDRFVAAKQPEVEKWALLSAVKDDMGKTPRVGRKTLAREAVVSKETMTR